MPVASLFRFVSRLQPRACAVPEGRRVYAVGDIHGRRDLLDRLLGLIEEDDAARGAADTELIFLGDLVDRGPDSRGVVERLLALSKTGRKVRFLLGNHEDVFVRAAQGDARALRFLTRIGGRETLYSYGISPEEYRDVDFDELAILLSRNVPPEHVEFLSSFESWIEIGDYVFVHAGVRPGVAMAEQIRGDLCWIRENFSIIAIISTRWWSMGIASPRVDERPNRIGIDTGAYASGRLTAIGLEGAERWFLTT